MANGHIIVWEEQRAQWAEIMRNCFPSSRVRWSHPASYYDSSSVSALIALSPTFVILPLTIPQFNSLRLAELVHRAQVATRLILISDTNCPHNMLIPLFDSHSTNSELTAGWVMESLQSEIKRKMDGHSIRQAISSILRTATCFRLQPFGTRHAVPRQAEIADYDNPSQLWALTEWRKLRRQLSELANTIAAQSNDEDITAGIRRVRDALHLSQSRYIEETDAANEVLMTGQWAVETALRFGLNLDGLVLPAAVGVGDKIREVRTSTSAPQSLITAVTESATNAIPASGKHGSLGSGIGECDAAQASAWRRDALSAGQQGATSMDNRTVHPYCCDGGATMGPAAFHSVLPRRHVFLSYCRDNSDDVRQLREDLLTAGENVWWDQDILPGQDWKLEIRKAMRDAYAVVLCLSGEAAARTTSGLYPEVADAVTAYREYTPGSIYLIPVRLSACDIPQVEIDGTRTLDRLQYVDLFPSSSRPQGVSLLVRAIKASAHHP